MMTGTSCVSLSRFSARVSSRPLDVRQHPIDEHEIRTLIGKAGASRTDVPRPHDTRSRYGAIRKAIISSNRSLVFDDEDLLGRH